MNAVLPAINASLNGIAACLLVSGFVAIRRGHRELHRRLMQGALMTSALFLVCYVVYHALFEPRRYAGPEALKPAYLAMLASHVVLAALMVVPILMVWRRAAKGRFEAHRRLARWILPVWLYVSVTGVLIYLVLYQL